MSQIETYPAEATQPSRGIGLTAETMYDKCVALARNLWWSWHPEVINLFRDLDPIRWRQLDHNPIALLSEFTPERLEMRAAELVLYSRINYAYRRLKEYVAETQTWGSTHAGVLGAIGLVAAFVAGGFGLWWAMTPGEQVSTEGVMGPECEAAIWVGDLASDDQAILAVGHALEELQRANRARRSQRLPESVRWLEGLEGAGRHDREALGMFLPSEATIALEPRAGAAAYVAAVNFRAYTRMVKAALGLARGRQVPGQVEDPLAGVVERAAHVEALPGPGPRQAQPQGVGHPAGEQTGVRLTLPQPASRHQPPLRRDQLLLA